MGFLTYLAASKNNPYVSMGWFFAGAIFGVIACILAYVLSADTSINVITSQPSTSHAPLPANNFENRENNNKTILSTDNWKCTCGVNRLDIISEDIFIN